MTNAIEWLNMSSTDVKNRHYSLEHQASAFDLTDIRLDARLILILQTTGGGLPHLLFNAK